MTTTAGDLTNVGIGYVTADPTGAVLNPLNNLLLNATAMPPNATEEVVRMVAGLLLAVVTKVLYGWIDRKFSKKENETETTKK